MKPRFHHRHYNTPAEALRDPVILSHLSRAVALGQISLHQPGNDYPTVTGVTVCYLEDPDTRQILSTGYAFCGATDQFDRAKGRRIAEGRARKGLTR